MTRKAKAFWIGFLAPVIPGCGVAMVSFVLCYTSSGADEMRGLATAMGVVFFGGPSILLGLLIGLIARFFTRNKPRPLKCGKCGYSLVGLTSGKCPECGCEVCAGTKP